MAFLDKLKFWKHEDPFEGLGELEPAFPTGGGPPFGNEGPQGQRDEFGSLTPISRPLEQSQPFSATPVQSPYQIVQPQPIYQQVQPPLNKDIEILSLKLDTIKNMLDTINMRLEHLERTARGEDYPMKQGNQKW